MNSFTVRECGDIETIKALFKEYSTIKGAEQCFVSFGSEIADLEGYYAIDVKSVRDQWRIIVQPLDDKQHPFVPCYIDQISAQVRIVEIAEVSKHYE